MERKHSHTTHTLTHPGRGPCRWKQWVQTRHWSRRRSRWWRWWCHRWWEGYWTGCSWRRKQSQVITHPLCVVVPLNPRRKYVLGVVESGRVSTSPPFCLLLSYLSRLLMEEVPLSTLLSTSPVRLSRCQRRDRPCRWENKHTWSVEGERQRETSTRVTLQTDRSHYSLRTCKM